MPWVVKENEGRHCVYKKGGSTPIKGGCHDSRDEAVKHMQALYANSKKDYHLLLDVAHFSDIVDDTENPNVKWVQAWRYSTWKHPVYGDIKVTPQLVQQFKEHLDSNTLGQEILVNYDHYMDPAKGRKSAGRVVDIEAREDGGWYKVEFTQEAIQEINDKQWRYLSPEYGDILDTEKGESFENVPLALALTNQPFFKNMAPMNFSEFFTEVDKQEDEVMPEWLKKLFTDLGVEIKDDASDEDNAKKFSEAITALKTKAETEDGGDDTDTGDEGDEGTGTEEQKSFSEMFPEVAQELAELRKVKIASEANEFARQFSEFTITEKIKDSDGNEVEKKIKKGISPAAQDELAKLHLAFSEGKATPDMVGQVLGTVMASGVVEFGERGSSADNAVPPGTSKEAAVQLRDRAKQLIEEAGGKSKMSFGDALAKAAAESPEFAAAYREGR